MMWRSSILTTRVGKYLASAARSTAKKYFCAWVHALIALGRIFLLDILPALNEWLFQKGEEDVKGLFSPDSAVSICLLLVTGGTRK